MSELLLNLKPECNNCPLQVEAQRDLLRLSITKHILDNTGAFLVGESGEHFDELLAYHMPGEDLDELKQEIRKSVGNGLEDVDLEIDKIKSKSQRLTDSCNGTLKMRATKAGTTYTVSICTSSTIDQGDKYADGQALTAHVLITPEKK